MTLRYKYLLPLIVLGLTACGNDTSSTTNEQPDLIVTHPESSTQTASLWEAASAAYEAGDSDKFLDDMLHLNNARPYAFWVKRNLLRAYAMKEDEAAIIDMISTATKQGVFIPLHNIAELEPFLKHPEVKQAVVSMIENDTALGEGNRQQESDLSGLLVEGIAKHPSSDDFFLSTVNEGNIWRVDANGHASLFVANDAAPCLLGLFGMAVDAKRNILWVASSKAAPYHGVNKSAQCPTGLFRFDINSGAFLGASMSDTESGIIGDITLNQEGVAFATDGELNFIYAAAPDERPLYGTTDGNTVLSMIGATDDYPNLQGLTFAADDKTLILADYHGGLLSFDTDKLTFSPIASRKTDFVGGIDGLYRFEDQYIGIQNGANPQRIIRFSLNKKLTAITSVEVLARKLDEWSEPSLGFVGPDQLYYNARSQWPGFDGDGNKRANFTFENALIGTVPLRGE